MRVTPSNTPQGEVFPLKSQKIPLLPVLESPHVSKKKRKPRKKKVLTSSVEGMVMQSSDTTHQNVTFHDEVEEDVVSPPVTLSSMQLDSSPNIALGDFFERPVLIKTYTWAEGLAFSQTFSPWYEYFNNVAVKKKLDYYYLIRCNLNLKFVINASPFYYSCIMVTYRPLSNAVTFDSFEPCAVNGGIGLEAQQLLGRSQRPRVMLYPQNSQGGCMKLPFFWPKNWLNANVAKDFISMGTINMDSLFFVLENANNVLGTGCTIQVYAWADSVELAGPTVGLAMQSRDEYGQGVVSKPASAIARYAQQLSSWPIIGPFATATSLAAGATSQIASIFGYTNVPVISDVPATTIKTNPNFASTDIGTAVEKLTLDSKNELSIDPKTCGLDVGDELSIPSIVIRESFLQTYLWTSSDAPDKLIFNAIVTPEICSNLTVSAKTYIQGTPMWMVSQMFRYWRGDIKFRFKILCTQYHRGRLKISWDPFGAISTTPESTNLVYTEIIDITESTDYEMSIPYTQPTSYLNVAHDYYSTFSDSPLVIRDGFSNGVLTVRVLTTQTSPSSSADIGVSVFVSGCPNLEFAAPISDDSDLSLYALQSKNVVSTVSGNVGIKSSSASDFINLIHMGEHVVSLRTLLRRSEFHRTLRFLSTDFIANSINYLAMHFPRMPLYYGWDINGIDQALSGATPKPFNYVFNTRINWVSSCFVAVKGSVVWTVDTNIKSAAPYSMVAERRNQALSVAGYKFVGATANGANSSEYVSRAQKKSGSGGLAMSDSLTQHGGRFHVPYYSKLKFSSTNPLYRTLGSNIDQTIRDTVSFYNTTQLVAPASNDSVNFDFYCSAGTDFNPIFFLNVPGYVRVGVGTGPPLPAP